MVKFYMEVSRLCLLMPLFVNPYHHFTPFWVLEIYISTFRAVLLLQVMQHRTWNSLDMSISVYQTLHVIDRSSDIIMKQMFVLIEKVCKIKDS